MPSDHNTVNMLNSNIFLNSKAERKVFFRSGVIFFWKVDTRKRK